MNIDKPSLDVEDLLASSDPAADITELEMARSRKRSLSIMLPEDQTVTPAPQALPLPVRTSRHKRLWLSAGALAGAGLLGGTTVLLTASAPAPPDRFLDASRIIPSLAEPQKETDKVPAFILDTDGRAIAHDAVSSLGIDPLETRRVGQTRTYTYYAAPAKGDMICVIDVVTQTNTVEGSGCGMLKNFESYGMKSVTPDGKESAWLLVPAAVEQTLESVVEEPGWEQQAPNFLVRNLD